MVCGHWEWRKQIVLAQAAITTSHAWWLEQQRFISHISGGWNSESRVSAWSRSGGNPPPGLLPPVQATFSLCPHMAERGSTGVPSFS